MALWHSKKSPDGTTAPDVKREEPCRLNSVPHTTSQTDHNFLTGLTNKNLFCQILPKEGQETSGEGGRKWVVHLGMEQQQEGRTSTPAWKRLPSLEPLFYSPFLPTESLAPGIHLLTSPIATIPWCLPPINSLSPTAHRSYWRTPEPPSACHDSSLDCPPRKYSQLFFTVPFFFWKSF